VIAIILLVLAGLICVAFALIMLYFAIKHKDNEIVTIFIIGLAICVGGAVWCANEGIKRADIYDKANK
jgi:hypothetical protein